MGETERIEFLKNFGSSGFKFAKRYQNNAAVFALLKVISGFSDKKLFLLCNRGAFRKLTNI